MPGNHNETFKILVSFAKDGSGKLMHNAMCCLNILCKMTVWMRAD